MAAEIKNRLLQRLIAWIDRKSPGGGSEDRLSLDSTIAVISRLVRENWRAYWPRYALAFVFMAIVAGTTALSAWIMKDVINRIFVDRSESALFWVPLTIIVIFVGKGLATYFQEVILSRIGNSIVASMQKRMYNHMLLMGSDFYQELPSGDLTMRITYAANAARDMLNLVAVSLGRDLMTLISLVCVMFAMNPVLAGIALLVGPFAAIGLRKMVKRVQKAARSEVTSLAAIIGTMRETSQGIRIVKSFQLEPVMSRKMFGAVEAVERLSNRIARTQAGVNPLIETLGGFAIALVVTYAGWQTLRSASAPGEFFAFITSLLLAADPARRLSKMQLSLATQAILVRMMFQTLDRPPTDDPKPGETDLIVKQGAVRLEDVHFAYNEDTGVLNGMTFEAPPGKVTALVGPSGGGKTTVFNLLMRFWEPADGKIYIDNQPIETASLLSLRNQIAYVSQDVFLFEGSVRENITIGRDDLDDEKIQHAAKLANAHDFIMTLPQQYDTPVGELGSQISGGQRQRISIARAFLKDAPIVLLDEPTSALDSESEQLIQAALATLTRGRTTLVIAHRLSTILHADVIHVIESGRVLESGSHAQLLKNEGLYNRLFEIQFGERNGVA
ncbi:MAG: ABC transporter ATP-binding protein [Hyphomicrobiaceae bacterium]